MAFIAWILMVRWCMPAVVIHENVKQFPFDLTQLAVDVCGHKISAKFIEPAKLHWAPWDYGKKLIIYPLYK